MLNVTMPQLFEILKPDYSKLAVDESTTKAVLKAFETCQIVLFLADSDLAASYFGGDDLIGVTKATVNAMTQGYSIATWYDEDTNCGILIIGYRQAQSQSANVELLGDDVLQIADYFTFAKPG